MFLLALYVCKASPPLPCLNISATASRSLRQLLATEPRTREPTNPLGLSRLRGEGGGRHGHTSSCPRVQCARWGALPSRADNVIDQMRRLQRESQTGHEFHIFWVPRRTLVSDNILEEAGILGDANIAELPLYFFPLEHDVLSLELDDSFRDLYLSRDPTSTFLLARALMEIQQRHGLFPRIIGKGDNAKRVEELLSRMRHSRVW